MVELWVIYALIFGAALLSIQAGYWLIYRTSKTQKSINRRLALGAQGASPTAVLETLHRERGFSYNDNPLLKRVNDFWTQTGLRFDSNIFALASFTLGGFFFIIFGVALGFGFAPLVLAPLAAAMTIYLYLRRARQRRIARFGEQLPDAVDIIVRGIKVGYPFSNALSLVAREMPDPIGTEFGMTGDEISFGLDVRTALENLFRRVGQEDLLFLVIAVSIQTQTGGALSEILSRLSRLIRQRATLRLKVRALTAEGRLSAIFLTLMPFLLIAVISLLSPEYFGSVRNHPIVIFGACVALTMLLIGNVIMYRMVNFKF